jgi:uncharacterized protein YutE (UPF0331/DUF86 family)
MADRDVILGKINSIQNALQRVNETAKKNPSFWDYDAQDIIILNLQRAIQVSIDIAAHIVASGNLGIVKSLKDLFKTLESNKILTRDISSKMQKMLGFRNIAVHDYQDIDVEILQNVVKHHLVDFETFYSEILGWCPDESL